MVLVKLPIPVPLAALLSEIVGFGFNPYTTPRAVTGSPPSSVIFPLIVAVVDEILAVVVPEFRVGATLTTSFLHPINSIKKMLTHKEFLIKFRFGVEIEQYFV